MEKFVRLTKKKIEEVFDFCNETYFNNEVEKPVYFETWTPNVHIIGMVRPIFNQKTKTIYSALHISNNYNWTETNLIETILHEMIHLYIKDYINPKRWWHFFFPPRQHNKEFKRVMAKLNKDFNLNIAIKAPWMKQYRKTKSA